MSKKVRDVDVLLDLGKGQTFDDTVSGVVSWSVTEGFIRFLTAFGDEHIYNINSVVSFHLHPKKEQEVYGFKPLTGKGGK